jgi:NADH-quinone oxidoreductase subunit H
MLVELVIAVAKMLVVVVIMFTVAPLLILMERRVSAFIQGRKGPNRVGPFGSLQPVADIIKCTLKEVTIPRDADRALFMFGPLLALLPPMLGWAVIPFGPRVQLFGVETSLQVAPLGIGILFTMSVLSIGVYGITLGGWASNNKFSLLGSMRASAQLISYELTLGLSILAVVMMSQSLDLQTVVTDQAREGWNLFGRFNPWLLPSGLVGFVLTYTCALAENNRLPFDMAECEAELVGGFHTEYNSMGWAAFAFSEYIAMTLSAALVVTLFLGGWHVPFITVPDETGFVPWYFALVGVAAFVGKVVFIDFTYIWIRWTLPRFRYDQVMSLGWKRMLPVALVNIGIIAVVGVFGG